MSDREIWKQFLENVKSEMTDISFDTWFNEEDTKFYSLKNNVMTITVNQEFIKKHIIEHYMDIMTEAINRVTNSNVTINVLLENEVKKIEAEDKKNNISLIKKCVRELKKKGLSVLPKSYIESYLKNEKKSCIYNKS